MSQQFALLHQRKFRAMFFTQFLGAFNDNVFKQALILVLTYSSTRTLDFLPISVLNNLAAMLFILPYFLFSAVAGQVADKYEKSVLTQQVKLLEIIIMVAAAVGFIFQWYWFLFLALFLMGTHSTFFGPIKYAYLPEVMQTDELVGANGLFQMGTSLAILTGMITAGILTQLNHPLHWVSAVVVVVALLGYIAARRIPTTITPTHVPNIDWNIIRTSVHIVRYLHGLPLLFFVVMGNSWFWFYGATFLTQTPEFSKIILHGNESVVILLLTLFSVGVALGSVLCKTLTKNQVSLRLLPVGIMGLSVFAMDLFFGLSSFANHNQPLLIADTYLGIRQLIPLQGSLRVFVDLFLLGFSGGIYIVPLYAFMQAYAPVSHRARIVGANNIFNALYMVGSALFSMFILSMLGLSITQLFLITAIMNAIFGLFLYKKLRRYQNTLPIQAHH